MLLLIIAVTASAQLQVKYDKQNVVASRIIGTWTVDSQLNSHLQGYSIGMAAFTKDYTVVKLLPKKYNRFFNKYSIYLAGWFTMKRGKFPFVLISHKGNPHIVYFRKRGNNPYGDAESFNVMMARAKNKNHDLLFIGGDFNNQPFTAMKRRD